MANARVHLASADSYLTVVERTITGHKLDRLRLEIEWRQRLLDAIPAIAAHQRPRRGVDND